MFKCMFSVLDCLIEICFYGARNLNRVPYHAQSMAHKLHIDQNEKVEMIGGTNVIAIDGFISKIVADYTMPVKNNLMIHEEVFR